MNAKGPSRKARLESLLHREIATVVQQELRDPRLGFITVLRVEMTDDLHQVTAYWSVLGEGSDRRLAEQALEQARGYVQRAYAHALHTRVLPVLRFAYDDSEARRRGMADLIRHARATDSDAGKRPEPPSADTPSTTPPSASPPAATPPTAGA